MTETVLTVDRCCCLPASADCVAARIQALLATRHPPFQGSERRLHRRYPFPHLLRITPLEEFQRASPSRVIACGKDLSVDGISFYHPRPLPYRRVVVTFDGPEEEADLSVIASLDWCRFTNRGWYLSGGRLLRVVSEATQRNDASLDSMAANDGAISSHGRCAR